MKQDDYNKFKVFLLKNLSFFTLFLDCINRDQNTIVNNLKNIKYFEYKESKINLAKLFLLNLLLDEYSFVIVEIITNDYIKEIIKFIKKIDDENKNSQKTLFIGCSEKNNNRNNENDGKDERIIDHLGLVLCAKTIIKLIDFYIKKTDKHNKDKEKECNENKKKECNEDEEKKLVEEKVKMKQIIEENVSIFSDYDLGYELENIIEKGFPEIYIELINNIIIKIKSNHKEYKYENLIEKLDLETINIIELIQNEKTNFLFKKINDNIQKYEIIRKEDLTNENKINFYYYLLKYVLKTSKYKIYNISFLLKTRGLLLNLLKKNELFFIEDKSNIEEKRQYVIKSILDNEYYYSQINNKKEKNQGKYLNDLEKKNKDNNISTIWSKCDKKNDDEEKILELSNECGIYKKQKNYYARKGLAEKQLDINDLICIIERKLYPIEKKIQLLLIKDDNTLYSLVLDFEVGITYRLEKLLDMSEYEYIEELIELDKDNIIFCTKNEVFILKNVLDIHNHFKIKVSIVNNDLNLSENWKEPINKLTKENKLRLYYHKYKINNIDNYLFDSSIKNLIIGESNNDENKILVSSCKNKLNENIILIFFEYEKEPFKFVGFKAIKFVEVQNCSFNAYNPSNDIAIFRVDFNSRVIRVNRNSSR